MEYAVSAHNNSILAHGQTDNPYQIRNMLLAHLRNEDYDFEDDFTITTKSHLKIKCTANLHDILKPKPIIKENPTIHLSPVKPVAQRMPKRLDPLMVPLSQICKDLKMKPIIARRILRKHRGVLNQRYEWLMNQVEDIKRILKGG